MKIHELTSLNSNNPGSGYLYKSFGDSVKAVLAKLVGDVNENATASEKNSIFGYIFIAAMVLLVAAALLNHYKIGGLAHKCDQNANQLELVKEITKDLKAKQVV